MRRQLCLTLCGILLVTAHPLAADDTPAAPPLPNIPDKTFTITDYGAVGDGKTLNTTAIQKAIDACSKAGGGTVLFPSGRFLSGAFTLASNLNLKIDKDSALLFANNRTDLKLSGNGGPACISGTDCHDLSITGAGTIDGQGQIWWSNFRKQETADDADPSPRRPNLINLNRCDRVLVQDILLTNSPMFHLVPRACQNVTVENVRIKAPSNAPNTDGMDPSGWNYLIDHCTFDVGDDCIALKPTTQIDPDRPSCENFTITNCTFLHGHGMSIGGQSNGGLEHLIVRDCTFDSTDAGIRMKSSRIAGGLCENMLYENLTMKNVKNSIMITSYYPRIPPQPQNDPAQPVGARTPIWRHIRITNIKSEDGVNAGQIVGLPEMPVSDIVLSDVSISAGKGLQIANATGIRFENSQIVAKTGPPLTISKADVTGIDPSTGK